MALIGDGTDAAPEFYRARHPRSTGWHFIRIANIDALMQEQGSTIPYNVLIHGVKLPVTEADFSALLNLLVPGTVR